MCVLINIGKEVLINVKEMNLFVLTNVLERSLGPIHKWRNVWLVWQTLSWENDVSQVYISLASMGF